MAFYVNMFISGKMEVCVDSFESAINAVTGGAHRLELCSALNEGGLTPSLELYKILKPVVSIPIFIMLRPKSGDFFYSNLEVNIILRDLILFKEAGANGFVFGALNNDKNIDIDTCVSVILSAYPLPVTFHRAFDVATMNPIKMANKIADLGFKRLLTSGRCSKAIDGKFLIKTLVDKMKNRLVVIPGAGIGVENLEDILITTSAIEFHGSAKVLKSEKSIYITDCNIVKELLRIYKKKLSTIN